MFVTICRSFHPDEGAVAGYGNRIRVKYTAKWGAQIAGPLFQTQFDVAHHAFFSPIPSISRIPLDQYRYLQNDVRAYSYSVKFLCSRQFNSFFPNIKKDPCPVLFTGKDLLSYFFSYYSSASSGVSVISVSVLSPEAAEAFVSGSAVSALSFSTFSPVTASNA